MVAKRWRFERVLPSLTVLFGIVTLAGGFIHNYPSLVGTRLILGLFEGALFPCVALFVANWYKREEMAVRVGFLFGEFYRLWLDAAPLEPSLSLPKPQPPSQVHLVVSWHMLFSTWTARPTSPAGAGIPPILFAGQKSS